MSKSNQVYYFDIAEGRWQGEFSFRIEDWAKFVAAPISLVDRTFAVLLDLNGRLPGKTIMEGEILGEPAEGDAGVARIEVAVSRFGLEVFRLSGHYALAKDGAGVDIAVLERFGPPGFPVRGPTRRDATIDMDGYRATYRISSLGAEWEGVYDLTPERTRLTAKYRSAWGSIGEAMDRTVRVVPLDPRARDRWERLLSIARRLEALNRTFDGEDDPRSCFAHVYSVITRNLAFALDDSGFEDPEWVIQLAENFAGHFFAAAEAWPKGTAPNAWAMVLDALTQSRFTSIEEFVLQMFVHIVHDLPRALAETKLTYPNGRSRIEDFHRINTLLNSAIDELQERMGRRYHLAFLVLDRLFLRHDEKFAEDKITGSRKNAWYDAERLADLTHKQDALKEIDDRVRDLLHKVVGTSFGWRLLMRGVRAGFRALRLRPMIPPPAASLGAMAPKPPQDPTSAAIYSLITAIGTKLNAADPPALLSAIFHDEVQVMLGSRSLSQLTALGRADAWREAIPRLVQRSPSDRYALAALVGDLLEGADLERSLQELRVSMTEHAAIRAFQRAVHELLDDGPVEALARAAQGLESLGIPSTAPLLGFSQLQATFDAETEIFEAHVPVLFRVPFEEIQHVIAPADWDDSIKQVVDTHWIVPNEILYEEVNVLSPWLEDHPLHLRTTLRIEETQGPGMRKVEYFLHESLDGSLDIDEGFISVESKGAGLTLVTIHKKLRVKNNPVLFAMLRFNPNGLAALLSHWIHEASLHRMPSAA